MESSGHVLVSRKGCHQHCAHPSRNPAFSGWSSPANISDKRGTPNHQSLGLK